MPEGALGNCPFCHRYSRGNSIRCLWPVRHSGVVPFVGFVGELVGIQTTGYSLLSGGIVLAVMVIPFIVSISVEVLRMVPEPLRESALALGATKWEAIKHVVLKKPEQGYFRRLFWVLAQPFRRNNGCIDGPCR